MDEPHDYFGEEVAATYDDETDVFGPGDVDATVDLLAELAGDGRALELGIGTGRIGLPLAARGVPVQGIELSRAMAARLPRHRFASRREGLKNVWAPDGSSAVRSGGGRTA